MAAQPERKRPTIAFSTRPGDVPETRRKFLERLKQVTVLLKKLQLRLRNVPKGFCDGRVSPVLSSPAGEHRFQNFVGTFL